MAEMTDTDQSAQGDATQEESLAAKEAQQKAEAEMENRRSAVRVGVTYIAAGFLFVVGPAFVAFLLAIDKHAQAKDVFFAILPVAAAIVTYWFATRRSKEFDADGLTKIIDASKRNGLNQ